MLTFVLVLLLILCLVEYFVNCNKFAQSIKRIPGDKGYFILGNALEALGTSVDIFQYARRTAKKFNGIYHFFAFNIGAINIYNPEDIEIILSNMKYHEKSFVYDFLRPWLQDGLLVSSGSKWQKRRKILTSSFHFNILRQYYPILEENSQRLVKILENKMDQPIDIIPLLSEYTLCSICESAMGTNLSDRSSLHKSYRDALHGIANVIVTRFLNFHLHIDFIFQRTKLAQQQRAYIKTLHTFTQKVINDRKSSIENQTRTINPLSQVYKNGEKSVKKRAAMLDLLIAAENEKLIDSEGIQEEVDTFMFEGHDTSAAGLIYSLLLIANNKDVQDKIIAELDSIFQCDKRSPTTEDLTTMKYIERWIKESLRLYPPVPFISRSLSTSVKLTNYTAPAGSLCHIHIFDLHRREELFKDALKFDPDRFLPENIIKMHNYAYIPFSAGPRNCIGQKFAMMEMKSAIATLLRNFKLIPVTTPSSLQFTADLVLRSCKPVYIQFKKRI